VSVIVALRDKKNTWIGSDTRVVSGGIPMNDGPKWVICHPWALGIAGSCRARDVVRYNIASICSDTYNEYDIVQALVGVLDTHNIGFVKDAGMDVPDYGQNFILAHAKLGIWGLCNSLSLSKQPRGKLWATGSGRSFALGAGFVSRQADSKGTLKVAIEAAMNYDINCGGKTWIKKL